MGDNIQAPTTLITGIGPPYPFISRLKVGASAALDMASREYLTFGVELQSSNP
jgi:hypothetical protein